MRTTVARDLYFFQGKFVVVSDFLTCRYMSLCIDENLLLTLDSNYFCVTVWLRRAKIIQNYGKKIINQELVKVTTSQE